ncbi:MAG TPA: acetate--CoA ligase family protein [Patescibacteria group bacterium]|nr:acetate--CoA ligase family protein [Patescibacteria group bacterium]
MDLTPLMKPKSIGVIGASQRIGRATRVIVNLQRFGYAGRIFPINPKYAEILGLPCYPDLASTPEAPETVVVAIPGADVPGLLATAADRGVRGAVILSSGFGEAGPAGRERQAALERLAAERGLLLCGPNCYGVLNVRLGSATFSADFAEPPRAGHVALVSQSGGFSHALAEHLMRQRAIGLSYIVSCGNQAGLTVEDYVEFLVEDEDTAVIGMIVEGFRQPGKLRRVAALARERGKPIVALKVGRSENARQAVLAHTGSLAGTPEIIDAVLRQHGIVQVASLNEMLDTLTLMDAIRDYRRRGWRVAVLSGLGGECGRVADVAERVGVGLPPLSPASVEALARFMPDFANPRNPLDGTGAMYEDATLFPRMIDVLLRDDTIDVIAVNFRANVPPPGGWAPSRQFSQALQTALRDRPDKLVLAFSSFAGGDLDQDVVRTLAEVGVPFLEGSESAMMALRHAREHRRFLEGPADERPPAVVPVSPAERRALGNAEAMRLLRAFGIPLAETVGAAEADEAVRGADRLGYPVVLKIDSPDIVHKTDVGGVRVGCADAHAVRRAFHEMREEVRRRAPAARIDGVVVQRMITGGTEMILGVKHDPTFGPAVVCGFGGVFVEVMRDVAVGVPPLDLAEARAMIGGLRGSALLRGARGRPPADVGALADALVRLATLADAQRERVRALDINPLVVLEEGRGVVAVDWLVELA